MTIKIDAAAASETYDELRPRYQSLAETIRTILTHAIPDGCSVHSIEVRAKSVDSFRRKAEKPSDEDASKAKYTDPLAEITDLAGVRVIAFFPKSLARICDAIEKEFKVTWKMDVGEERFSQGRFGYKSIHYLVELPSEKTAWAEYRRFADMVAEIQVRTILQHAWAEMEHDIQYKSSEQIPTSIQRRFVALAGMLEIADREFQAIQDEDAEIHHAVRSSLQDDLTITTLATETTTEERLSPDPCSDVTLEPPSGWNPRRARDLVASGNYDEAIAQYSKTIELNPSNFTLYIGRAKARFLGGDRSGALADLAIADAIQPNDRSIQNLRGQIAEGVLYAPTSATEAWQHAAAGNDYLARGGGEEAFRRYSQAQELGFHAIFSTFNKAMACALIKDSDGATYFLDQFSPIPNSPTEVNSLALRAIVAAIAKQGYSGYRSGLQEKLSSLSGYDFSQSPLRHLERGFYARDTRVNAQIELIFALLKRTAHS